MRTGPDEIISHCNKYIIECIRERMRSQDKWFPFVSRREYTNLLEDYQKVLNDFKLYAEQQKEYGL